MKSYAFAAIVGAASAASFEAMNVKYIEHKRVSDAWRAGSKGGEQIAKG